MPDANELKIQARRHEADGEYAEASRMYQRALSAMDAGDSLPDPSLLVRVADLEYRQGKKDSALGYYQNAVAEYEDQGLITNAIAVCNKILRVFPQRVECYRQLAELHMGVGLAAEARQNLLRYASEAWNEDEPETVIEAMQEFLDRSPDQEVCLRLVSCLREVGREEEAIASLRKVWSERTRADADVEALEWKARELDAGIDLDEWRRADDDFADEDFPAAAGEPVDAGDAEEERPAETLDVAEEPAAEEAAAEESAEPEGAGDAVEESPEEEDEEESGWPDRDPRPLSALVDEVLGRGAAEAEAEDAVEDETEPAADLEAAFPGDAGPATAASGEEEEVVAEEERVAEDEPVEAPASEAEAASEAVPDEEPEDEAVEAAAAPRPGATAEVEPPAELETEPPAEPAAAEPVEEPVGESVGSDRDAVEPTPETAEPEAPGPDLDDELEDEPADEAAEEAAEPAARDHAVDRPSDDGARDLARASADELEIMAEFPDRLMGFTADARSNGVDQTPAGRSGTREDRMTADFDDRSADRANGGAVGTADFDSWDADMDEELGETAELRRGLELLDEMLEVQPDNMELRERKLRYAQRLGDPEVLIDAYLSLADALGEQGSRRSARHLYREVLELDEGNQRAEAGLARLDIGELEDKRQAGKRAGASHSTPRPASDEEKQARRDLGLRLWTEFENAIREMPWLHAATQAYQSTGPDVPPPVEAFEMLGHYLLSRGRHQEATDVLLRGVELSEGSDQELADLLYHLGTACKRMGREERARGYFDRLAAVDAEFARVEETLAESAGPGHPSADGGDPSSRGDGRGPQASGEREDAGDREEADAVQ